MKPAKNVVISLQKVSKIYKMGQINVHALREMSLDIKQGEFVSVMGPSGSGKSTAMNMIGSLDIPTHGHIYLYGQNISHLPESDLAQIRGKRIGFVFQKFNLIPTLSALENVMLPMMFQDVPREEAKKRAEGILKKVEMLDRATHKPGELSGGQQQRVSIARALANDPDIILADEPTGNLDSESGNLVLKVLKKLHNDGKTLIIVTHDRDLARNAKRMCILKDGAVVKIKKLR